MNFHYFVYWPSLYVLALIHILFLILEMFLWPTPVGIKVLRMTPDFASMTKILAMNQGLYNGFLALGLILAAFYKDIPWSLFFVSCIVVAGIFGALTANKKIFFLQALPAIIVLVIFFFIKFFQE